MTTNTNARDPKFIYSVDASVPSIEEMDAALAAMPMGMNWDGYSHANLIIVLAGEDYIRQWNEYMGMMADSNKALIYRSDWQELGFYRLKNSPK